MDLGENGDGLTLGLTNSGTPFLKKSPHTCAVCNFTFKTESQLFNHLDNCGLRRKYEQLNFMALKALQSFLYSYYLGVALQLCIKSGEKGSNGLFSLIRTICGKFASQNSLLNLIITFMAETQRKCLFMFKVVKKLIFC